MLRTVSLFSTLSDNTCHLSNIQQARSTSTGYHMALSHPWMGHNNSEGDINEAHPSTSKRSGQQPNQTIDFQQQQHSMCWQLLNFKSNRSSRKGKSASITAKMPHYIGRSMDTFGSQLQVSSQSSRHAEALLSSCRNAVFTALSIRNFFKRDTSHILSFPFLSDFKCISSLNEWN